MTGCQAGGGLSGANVLPSSNAPASNERIAPSFSTLRAAPQGVRTYVHLPLRNRTELERLVAQQSDRKSPLYHHFLTVAQFRAQYGPASADLEAAARALRRDGFKTTVTSQGVVADAPRQTVENVFRLHLRERSNASGLHGIVPLASDRAPTLPAELARVHAQVAAFAPVPLAKTMHLMLGKAPAGPDNRYGPNAPFYWFDDLKQAYAYPSYTSANGAGRTIAVVAASDFLDSDVAAYFGHEGLAVPNIVRRPVDGGSPPFNINSGFSDEVSLDVQQSAGSAPGATVMVYEAPDATFTPSFVDMYTAINEDNQADVVSTSFGLCELFFLASYNNGQDFTYLLKMFHDLFLQGNSQGITFVESSGDNGAQGGDCTDTTGANAVFGVSAWADDPNVTGVGGTNLVTSSIPKSLQSTYVSENAYADQFAPGQGFANGALWGSGGGVSVLWPKPLYQYFVHTGASTRAVPDIAMMMGGCPVGSAPPCGTSAIASQRSAFVTALGGGLYLLIGTSGSSPEFAGLQAIQDQTLGGRAGNVNYLIYGLAAFGSVGNGPVFHNNIPGNNGYPSHRGYNFVVGNGTPYAAQYALQPFAPLAGNPQTPSNP
ncbi:MAG: S8 family serine peptidase [Candidatus Eremiobacteraeota bacterium]|nr:S8 family serine peptidase [Candidatus Eremiobacteraeota bacterium]